MHKKVLLVDSDLLVRQKIEALFARLGEEWALTAVATGGEALELLSRDYHAIVADASLPDVYGVSVLTEASLALPSAARVLNRENAQHNLGVRAACAARQALENLTRQRACSAFWTGSVVCGLPCQRSEFRRQFRLWTTCRRFLPCTLS